MSTVEIQSRPGGDISIDFQSQETMWKKPQIMIGS